MVWSIEMANKRELSQHFLSALGHYRDSSTRGPSRTLFIFSSFNYYTYYITHYIFEKFSLIHHMSWAKNELSLSYESWGPRFKWQISIKEVKQTQKVINTVAAKLTQLDSLFF